MLLAGVDLCYFGERAGRRKIVKIVRGVRDG